MAYWNYDEYLGIGPGAHSRICLKDGNLNALMNYHQPEKWLKLVEENGHGLQTQQLLSDNEKLEEIIMMGMRLEGGITDEKLLKHLGTDFANSLNMTQINNFIEAGFIKFDGKKLSLTDKGLLMHSGVVAGILL
jgi:oxygen-independent coproporphyrinogen-3 oxidase